MPWCASCSRFLSPPTVRDDGTCPTCGRRVEPGGVTTEADERERLPWHLKLLAAAAALYLGWRAWYGVEWLIQRL